MSSREQYEQERGMAIAAEKWANECKMLARYDEICMGEVRPYTPPEQSPTPEPLEWQRVAVGVAKLGGVASAVAIVVKVAAVAITTAFAFIEANAGIICAGFVALVIALTASGGSGGTKGGGGYPDAPSGGNTITVNNTTTIVTGGTIRE